MLDALHVAVGLSLRVVLQLSGRKDRVPLPVLLGQQLLPFGEIPLEEEFVEQRDERLGVGGSARRVGESLVGQPLIPLDEHAELGPVSVRLEERQGDEAAVFGAVFVDQWVGGVAVVLMGEGVGVEHARAGDRHPHRPQAHRHQRDVDDDTLAGALTLVEGGADPAGQCDARLKVAEARPGHGERHLALGRRHAHRRAGVGPVRDAVETTPLGHVATGPLSAAAA